MPDVSAHRSLKEKQRIEREDLILQVAEAVFLEKGYHETSMDEIATRVGIAKGTLYLHFARKEDLVMALLERKLDGFIKTVTAILHQEGTPRERLSLLLRSMYLDLFGSHFRLIYVLYNSAEIQPLLRERKDKTHEMFKRIASDVSSLLEEGKAAGLFDPAIPTDIMLSIFFSQLSPLAYRRLIVDCHLAPEELARHIEYVFFNGIAAKTSHQDTPKTSS